MSLHPSDARPSRRGGVLLVCVIAVSVLAGIAAATFAFTLGHGEESSFGGRELRALYVAEAGVAETALRVTDAVDQGQPVPAGLGTEAAPLPIAGGSFTAEIADMGDNTWRFEVTGRVGLQRRTIEGRLVPSGTSAFDHAIFAGNTSGDPNYRMALGGTGSQADGIRGDVYSGGDISVDGDAVVDGELFAAGAIAAAGPMSGSSGTTREPLDIAAQDYANNNDVDVAAAFAAEGVAQGNPLGGTALEVPEASPAHIFRLNPDDRTTETSATVKDDYFLEDPYEPVTAFSSPLGSGHAVSLEGTSGNDAVYYVDGNLWIHNKPWGRMRFELDDADASGTDGVRLTFVVSGNLYISDDLLLEEAAADGVAFICIEDPAVADSGNVYFGDPRYGTLEEMNAFMYAENDFYDNNLSASGSSEVRVNGNMTAGNHVAINRDFVKPDGTVEHSRLEVNFDDRISTGSIVLPGLPNALIGAAGLSVAYWREVSE